MTKRTDKEGKMDGEGRGGPRMARRAHLCILKGHGRFSESSVSLVSSAEVIPRTKIIMWHQNLLTPILLHQSFTYISRCFTGKCLFCVRFAAAKPGNTQVVLYPLDWHWMTTLDQDRL